MGKLRILCNRISRRSRSDAASRFQSLDGRPTESQV